jgi:signal transduction histidine kinase
MSALMWFGAGLSLGLVLASGVLYALFRRRLARVRSAERRARTAERLAEVGSMTSGLAHEIKNPLSTIGLNAQLLSEAIEDGVSDGELRTRLTNRVRTLRRETERLKGILSDFLDYAGELRLHPERVDVNALVGELIDFYAPEAERAGVRLRADLAPGAIHARLDTRLIKQALLNLMLNAVQAMSGVRAASGGPTVGATAGELILRTQTLVEEGREVVKIHVIDTGPGITPENRSRIFEPYFTTKSGGTGLGLPTARRAIEGHAGRLDLYSEPGRGTDFTIVLPVAGPSLPHDGGTPDRGPAGRGGR